MILMYVIMLWYCMMGERFLYCVRVSEMTRADLCLVSGALCCGIFRELLWMFSLPKKNWKVKLSRNFFAYSFLPKMEKVELSENFFENLITKTILFPFTLYLRYISLTFELKFIQQNHLFFLILRPKDLCILEISQEFALF